MTDVLTHVLVAYAIATTISIRYEGLTGPDVTVCTMGAMIPDVAKGKLVVADWQVEAALGVPFSWEAIHTLGGSIAAALVGAFLVPAGYRRRVLALLVVGVCSHHLLDLLIAHPGGYVYDLFWPLSTAWVPEGGIYHSSDRWPLAVAATIAGLTALARRRFDRAATEAGGAVTEA